MSIETQKAIVRRYIDQILNDQRLDLIDEFFVDNVELHGVGPGIIGRTALAEFYAMFSAAFPDWHTVIDDMVAEGDKVVVRYTAASTHKGEFRGIPATGKSYTQNTIVIYRLTNGKIAEGWLLNDNLRMMQQLGVIPGPQAA